MSKCENCGHDCHCGSICEQSNVDEFGNKNTFQCCKNCRCEKVKSEEWKAGFNGR